MIFLRQSTASQEVPLGRFVDSTDGNTEETALSIANTDIKLWKTGATTLASKNSGGATHIANGEYYAVLDATDTDTIGPMKICIHVSGALYVQVWVTVLDEAVYDWMFGTVAPLTPTVAGRTLDVSSGGEAGVDWANVGSPTTTLDLSGTTIKTTQKVDVETIKTQAVTCGAGVTVLASVGTAATSTAQTGDTYALANGASGFVAIKGVVDTISTNVSTALSRLGAWTGSGINTILGAFRALAAKAAALTPTDLSASTTFDNTTDSAEAIRDNMGTAQTGDSYPIVSSGTHGNAALKALIDTMTAYVDTEVSAIKAKTDNLPASPANEATLTTIASYIDTEVAAIKAKTDNLPTDPADASDIAASFASIAATLATLATYIDTEVASILAYATRTVIRGTVGSSTTPSTTQFTPSAVSPSGVDADQFKGRTMIFDNDTLTPGLRGQATDITAASGASLPLLTFTALTRAPASGDTFSIQ